MNYTVPRLNFSHPYCELIWFWQLEGTIPKVTIPQYMLDEFYEEFGYFYYTSDDIAKPLKRLNEICNTIVKEKQKYSYVIREIQLNN